MKIIGKMGLALLAIGFLGLTVPGLEAVEITVKCNKGESVQSALDALTGPATIVVKGTCQEYIDVIKDDVIIQGGNYKEPSPSQPNQSIFYVLGARRVLITGVTITGGSNGIYVDKGGSLTLDGNSTISGAVYNGVASAFGSSVAINSSTIQGNLQGVTATDNSSLSLTNSTITANGSVGVLVQRSSSARIGQSPYGISGKNEITNNSGAGVSVTRSAYALIDGNMIIGNIGNGIFIEGASATVTNNTIANSRKGVNVINSGNARIGFTEAVQPGPNIIENNSFEGIQITNGGAAFIFGNTIRNNGLSMQRPGITIHHATAELIGGNYIQGNAGHGVVVNQGTLFQGVGDWNLTPGQDIIRQNGYSGIYGWNGANLDIRNVVVTNNTQNGIHLRLRSTLRIYDSTISDNGITTPGVIGHGVVLYDGSSVARYSTDSPQDRITGNSGWGVVCYGGSNLVGVTSGVDGNTAGEVNCPPIYIP